MSFDWKLYVQLAEELVNDQKTAGLREAYCRSAMSRSYYGVFCTARNLLLLINKGIVIPIVDTHKFVRERYLLSPDKIQRKIGTNLQRLWKERKDADYEETASVDSKRAKLACEMANRTLTDLKGIRP